MKIFNKGNATSAANLSAGSIFYATRHLTNNHALYMALVDKSKSSGRLIWVNLQSNEESEDPKVYFGNFDEREIVFDITSYVEFCPIIDSDSLDMCHGSAPIAGCAYPIGEKMYLAAEVGGMQTLGRVVLFDIESGDILRNEYPEIAIKNWNLRYSGIKGDEGLVLRHYNPELKHGIR